MFPAPSCSRSTAAPVIGKMPPHWPPDGLSSDTSTYDEDSLVLSINLSSIHRRYFAGGIKNFRYPAPHPKPMTMPQMWPRIDVCGTKIAVNRMSTKGIASVGSL